MRILLAGMRQPENQFTRALKRYGSHVEVIWTSPDPGDFRLDCDAAVIANGYISHAKARAVKDEYKKHGKPFFIADLSFSSIKERFEAFMDSKPQPPPTLKEIRREASISEPEPLLSDLEITNNMPKPTPPINVLGTALQAAQKKAESETKSGSDLIRECLLAEMSTSDILDMLKLEGKKKKDGSDYHSQDVHAAKYSLKKFGLKRSGIPPVQSLKTPPKKDAPKASGETLLPAQIQLSLMNEVMKSDKSVDEKLKLIAEIQSGSVTSFEIVHMRIESEILFIETRNSITKELKNTASLTRVSAAAVVKEFDKIKSFAEKGCL